VDRILINAGSGEPGGGQLPGLFASWRQVRVDIDPEAAPDIVADITDMAPIASGVADAVWTAHCVEHLYEHDVPRAMSEIRRVLRIAGLIAEDRMHEVLYMSAAGPITPHDIVFGHGPALARGQLAMAHRCGFTPTAMTRALAAAGFGGYALLRRPTFELAAVVRKRDWAEVAERDALLAALAL
jgi:SAM-dependent methyltransferase